MGKWMQLHREVHHLHLCILATLMVLGQIRVKTEPNFAQCIHFIRDDALHTAILIPCTSCCSPQTAYGAEYAGMNNKPQYELESVFFTHVSYSKVPRRRLTLHVRPQSWEDLDLQLYRYLKRDSLTSPWTVLWIIATFTTCHPIHSKEIWATVKTVSNFIPKLKRTLERENRKKQDTFLERQQIQYEVLWTQ